MTAETAIPTANSISIHYESVGIGVPFASAMIAVAELGEPTT